MADGRGWQPGILISACRRVLADLICHNGPELHPKVKDTVGHVRMN